MPASAWNRENTSPLADRSSHSGPEPHPLAIPQRPVLLLEEQQASRLVAARPQPGRVQVHEREQGEGLRDRAHGVLREERGQPDGLVAQLAADRLLRVRGEIALVEEQVEHRVHARQPGPQRLERRRLDVGRSLAQPVARARQALVHVRLGGEQPQRDLRGAEAAQRLQRQDQPAIPAEWPSSQQTKSIRSMSSATSPAKYDGAGWSPLSATSVGGPLQNPEPAGLPPQVSDQVVVGDPVQPGAGIVGKALRRPGRERGHERALDRVLHELEMPHADLARQQRHQPAVFVPEEMLDQARRGGRAGTVSGSEPPVKSPPSPGSPISTLDPGIITPGLSLATSSARSKLSAETSMYPPTISLASTKGPSVAPDVVTTLPPGLSLPPMSRILSLNFSFQALNAAYISCICAGEGGSRFPGHAPLEEQVFRHLDSRGFAPAASPAP